MINVKIPLTICSNDKFLLCANVKIMHNSFAKAYLITKIHNKCADDSLLNFKVKNLYEILIYCKFISSAAHVHKHTL